MEQKRNKRKLGIENTIDKVNSSANKVDICSPIHRISKKKYDNLENN